MMKVLWLMYVFAASLPQCSAHPTASPLSLPSVPPAPFAKGCRLLLNEIYFGENEYFFEIARFCEQDDAFATNAIELDKYAIIIAGEDDFIIGYCRLQGIFPTKMNFLFVVGTVSETTNVANQQCTMEGELGSKWSPRSYKMVSVSLVRNQRPESLSKFNLLLNHDKYIPKKLTPINAEFLYRNVQDYYFINMCQDVSLESGICSRMYTKYKAIGADILNVPPIAKSLNRCDLDAAPNKYLPMQSLSFHVGIPTPGTINICSEEEPPNKRAKFMTTNVNEVNGNEATTTATSSTQFQTVTSSNEVLIEESEKVSVCDNLSTELLKKLQSLEYQPLDLQDVMKSPTCSWFDYNQELKKMTCKMCQPLVSRKVIPERVNSPFIPEIAKRGVGQFQPKNVKAAAGARRDNRKLIMDHDNSFIHEISNDYERIVKSGKIGSALVSEFKRPGGPYRKYLNATENIVIAVVQSVRMNLPFRQFSVFAETLGYYGVPIGHLYRNPKGMKTILEIVGNKLHTEFVQNLKENQPLVGVIADSTTDIGGHGLLAIVFQTQSQASQVDVFLYRILKIPKGESGVELFHAFIDAIESDGLSDYLKANLVSVTTDGAPAMLSVFKRHLNEYVINEIQGVWCGAHRLELVSKVIGKLPFLRIIDDTINSIFKKMTVKSAPKRNILQCETEKAGFRPFEPKRVRDFRWVGHHVRAFQPLIYRYQILVNTLQQYSQTSSDPTARKENTSLLTVILRGTFLMTAAFVGDILEIIAQVSLTYQKKASSLIGTKTSRMLLENRLKSLEIEAGPNVKFLLENSILLEGTSEPDTYGLPVSMSDFETKKIRYSDIILNAGRNDEVDYPVYSNMNMYIDNLLTQLDLRFYEDDGDYYDMFMPSQLNGNENLEQCSTSTLTKMNTKFSWGYDITTISSEWRTLCTEIVTHPFFVLMSRRSPEEFWNLFLTEEISSWTTTTREIVLRALTVPSTSVEAERMFSIYNWIKTFRRFNLFPATVENLIRIKFNQKGNIADWSIVEFAEQLLLENHSRADDLSRPATKCSKEDYGFKAYLGLELDCVEETTP